MESNGFQPKWLWCFLALHAGSFWGETGSVTVRTPPSNPGTVEAQAKFFQDFFSVQLSPYKMEFGHVCEDPDTWEQRYEKKDFKNHRDMGKVRWGDKKGGYGEHYWDLNHAGHAGNHGDDGYDNDDGSYHEDSHNSPYDETHEHTPSYGNEEYEPEKSSYEESGRTKRAHPKIKIERKQQRKTESYEEESKPQKQKRRNRGREEPRELETAATHHDEEYSDDDEDDDEEEEEHYVKPKPKRQHHRKRTDEEKPQPKEKNQFVLVVSQKDDAEKQQYQQNTNKKQSEQQYQPKPQAELPQYSTKKPEVQQFVPYEGGAGVRQHQQPEVSAATNVPRLFLEPSTGHVVDRATGQAYVLQPIAPKYN